MTSNKSGTGGRHTCPSSGLPEHIAAPCTPRAAGRTTTGLSSLPGEVLRERRKSTLSAERPPPGADFMDAWRTISYQRGCLDQVPRCGAGRIQWLGREASLALLSVVSAKCCAMLSL